MTANVVNIISHPRIANKVRYTLSGISTNKRLNDIKISVPECMKTAGLREGKYSLTEAFELIAGDVTTIRISDTDKKLSKNDHVSWFNDSSTSSRLILKETYELLYMMADTPWLGSAKLEAKTPQNGIFIEGQYPFNRLIKSLGYLVEDAYHDIYGDDE